MDNNINNKPIIITDPENIPLGWDDAFVGNRLLNTRVFLRHLHSTNPVSQRYFYSCLNTVNAGTFYRTRLPVTLGPMRLSCPATVCGVPMIYGSEIGFTQMSSIHDICGIMNSAWPGFQIIGGLRQRGEDVAGWCWKRSLLTIDHIIGWNDFSSYWNDLTTGYRWRLRATLKKWENVKIRIEDNKSFTSDDYELYRTLVSGLHYKSETLPIEFFTLLPIPHFYLKAFYQDKVIGWILLIPENDVLHQLYIGYNRKSNHEHDIYINLLLEAIRFAIDKKYKRLKMGQTAELVKMRLGGVPEERYMLIRHTSPTVNWVINNTNIFTYRKHYPKMQVFKSRKYDFILKD